MGCDRAAPPLPVCLLWNSRGMDFADVPWKRGRGYDVEGLTNVLTANDAYAHLVIKQLRECVGDISGIRALGFCVSVKHAKFMTRVFTATGIPSLAVSGETTWMCADKRCETWNRAR